MIEFACRWSGIDAILYYIGDVFIDLGLTGGTTALLATGVTGVVFFVSTLPAMVCLFGDLEFRERMTDVSSRLLSMESVASPCF